MSNFIAPKDEAFFAAIGKLAVSWAHLELGLDWLIRIIHQELDGSEHVEADIPLSLQRKLRYLRKAFRTLPQLATFKDRFLKIADEISAASDERHDIIHGFVIHQIEGSGEAVMARLLPPEQKLKPFLATTETILKAAVRANKIYVLQFAEGVAASLAAI